MKALFKWPNSISYQVRKKVFFSAHLPSFLIFILTRIHQGFEFFVNNGKTFSRQAEKEGFEMGSEKLRFAMIRTFLCVIEFSFVSQLKTKSDYEGKFALFLIRFAVTFELCLIC